MVSNLWEQALLAIKIAGETCSYRGRSCRGGARSALPLPPTLSEDRRGERSSNLKSRSVTLCALRHALSVPRSPLRSPSRSSRGAQRPYTPSAFAASLAK
jgi:hypothetical protein